MPNIRRIKFPIILRWNEPTQQWRALNALTKTHIQELSLYECKFMKTLISRIKAVKGKDNMLSIEIVNICGGS